MEAYPFRNLSAVFGADSRTLPFLKIPPELRLMIYESALCDKEESLVLQDNPKAGRMPVHLINNAHARVQSRLQRIPSHLLRQALLIPYCRSWHTS